MSSINRLGFGGDPGITMRIQEFF